MTPDNVPIHQVVRFLIVDPPRTHSPEPVEYRGSRKCEFAGRVTVRMAC